MALSFLADRDTYLVSTEGVPDVTFVSYVVFVRVLESDFEHAGGVFDIFDYDNHYTNVFLHNPSWTGGPSFEFWCDGDNYGFHDLRDYDGVGKWVALAVTRDGANTTFRVKFPGQEGWLINESGTSAGEGPYPGEEMRYASERLDRPSTFEGSVCKVWDAVLSEPELEAECNSFAPVRTSDLNRYTPLTGDMSQHLLDLSGNGYHWSANNPSDLVIVTGPEPNDPLEIEVPSIASEEAFGAASLSHLAQSITATGISTGEAFGSHALDNADAQTLTVTGILSLEAFGDATVEDVVLAISIPGIASAEAFGSHSVSTDSLSFVSPQGIASLEAFGDLVIQGQVAQAVAPSAIDTAEAFGEPVLAQLLQSIEVSSIASAEAFGDVTFTFLVQTIGPSGIPSRMAFGLTRFEGGIVIEKDEVMFVSVTQPLFRPLWLPVSKE